MPQVNETSRTASCPRFEMKTGDSDDGLSGFVNVRPRLFGIAYHMLGSATEAEDILQEVWLRWQSANRRRVDNTPAFLATTTARLCINLVQAAHSRRETYTGTSLFEPVDQSGDPELCAERSEALRIAILVLLEKLSPAERAAYILHEAFDYAYCEIAELLHMQEANTRQLVSRARKHIAVGPRAHASSGEQRRLLKAFVSAAEGKFEVLEGVLTKDAVCYSSMGRYACAGAQFRRERVENSTAAA